MDRELTDTDREILARKEELRAKDRADVAAGSSSWAEMNRANSLGAPVIDQYRPSKSLGLKR